jgi:hypothetical protein
LLKDALIIVACIVGALVALFVITKAYAGPARKESNDFTGAVVAVIGTTYAVILAFMLSGVWNMFQQAQANEEQEANALVNIWRIATQLPVPGSAEAQAACLKYADNVVQIEWPAMLAKKSLPLDNTMIINQLWKFAGQVQGHSGNDSIAAYQMMEELRMLTEYRRIRIMQAREGLPGILWAVLIVGGIVTVAAACFFGVPSFRFHVLQVAVLSFLISLVLVAVADIDQPYQGGVTVQPEGFSFSRETITNSRPQ